MRYKFIILFLILGFVSKAQVYQLMPQYGYSTYRMNFDSTIQIPTFCGVPKLGSNKINKGALAFDSCNNRFYYFNPKTQIWDTIKSADASLFVKYTDTAQMLSAYLRKTDTISLSNRIEGKIDSLKLSNDSIYARKNNQFVFQYMNDTATVVKAFVRNVESFTINRGQVVYIFGASGDKASVKLADNSGDYTSSRTLGIVRENIAAGQTGWVTTQGQVAKLQLGSYNEGDVLWLDSIPGGFTKTKPVAPRHSVFLGIVERANNGNGIAYVKPQNGYEIGELHDVKITSPANNQVLAYTTNIWENKNIYSIVDTTSISNRINTKLNISDTSAMLSPYLRSIDTTNKFVTSVFRKTASDSVFFVRGGSNNFAFRDSTGAAGWGLLGNSGTNATTNFIGTTDNVNLVFRRNNVISGRIDSTNANQGTTSFGFRTTATGVSNTSFGYKALQNSTGSSNTAIGNRAGFNVTTGFDNSFFGDGAGRSMSTGLQNTAIGTAALVNNNGNANTAIGGYSLLSSSGSNNIGIGYYAGNYLTSGNNQIFINSLDRTNLSGDQNNSPFYAQQNSTVTSQIVTLNGRVGINTISPSSSAGLEVSSTTQGFLQPRLTTTQMNAISTPATGLSVFNTTDSVPYTYRGTTGGWQKNVIYNRNNDVALFNGANQRIMIDTTTNVIAGRNLTVEAGSTIAGGTSAFQPLSQTTRNYRGMGAASNGDIYVAQQGGPSIYRRTGGTGNFVALAGSGNRDYFEVAVAPNGDIYATTWNTPGGVFKSTDNGATFTSLGLSSGGWGGITVAPNGDVYLSRNPFGNGGIGDIYISTNAGSTFNALGQTSRGYLGMGAAPNGDIYVVVEGGGIFKRTGGTGNFIATGAPNANWFDVAVASNGDVYAVVNNGNIWRSTDAGTTFTSLGQTVRAYGGIAVAPNGDVYASVQNGDIFIQSQGTADLNGGTLVLQSGVGKGTGTSTINFNTGTTLASGSTLQTTSTKMTILGNGNVGIGTTSPSAKLELSDTARGFLQTRMTTTQRNNIASPSVGLQVFTTTDSSQYVYRGTGAGWQQIANEIVNTASLNFPSTNAQNSSDLTITLTGAVDGEAVVLGVPNAAVNANSCYTAWVSAANTVTVRFNNYSSGAIDPASATFKVTIIK